MYIHGEAPAASARNSEETGVVGDTAGVGLLHPRWGQALSETGRFGYARYSIIPSGFTDTTNVSPHQELCRTTQRACV
jgi:hypothetical protein